MSLTADAKSMLKGQGCSLVKKASVRVGRETDTSDALTETGERVEYFQCLHTLHLPIASVGEGRYIPEILNRDQPSPSSSQTIRFLIPEAIA